MKHRGEVPQVVAAAVVVVAVLSVEMLAVVVSAI